MPEKNQNEIIERSIFLKKDINKILLYCSIVFIPLATILYIFDLDLIFYKYGIKLLLLGEIFLLVIKVREKYKNEILASNDTYEIFNVEYNKRLSYCSICLLSLALIYYCCCDLVDVSYIIWDELFLILFGGITLFVVEIKEGKINKATALNTIDKYKNKDINKILTDTSTTIIALAVMGSLLHFSAILQGQLFLLAGILLLVEKRREEKESEASKHDSLNNYFD